jgi:AraC-like DNA-binding protein
MPSRHRAVPAELPLVFGCLPDIRARGRIQTALRDHANIRWFQSFDEIRRMLLPGERPAAAIVALYDACGGDARVFAREMRDEVTGLPIILNCDLGNGSETALGELADAGVHEVLFTGLNDEGFAARSAIFGAAVAGASDVVLKSIRGLVPDALMPFVESVVRRPRDLQRVEDVAATLHVRRQTLGRWCRANGYIRPEELLVWSRLLVVGALLDLTTRTIESIADDLGYGSPTALRMRIRAYTGMSSTQLRESRGEGMLIAFRRRLEEARAERQSVPGVATAAAVS